MPENTNTTFSDTPSSGQNGAKPKPSKRKKGKVFATSETMLALIEQLAAKQEEQVKTKLIQQATREKFFADKKLKLAAKKSKRVNKLEEIKERLKRA